MNTLQPAGAALESLDAAGRHVALLVAEIERHKLHIKHIGNDALRTENAELRARLAELEKQEPVMVYDGRCIWDCGDGGHQDVTMLKMIAKGTKLFAAAGASPVQPNSCAYCTHPLFVGLKCKHCGRVVQPSQAGEPVVYQSRMRPLWGQSLWNEWSNCTKGMHDDYKKTPILNDWEFEARALSVTPQTAVQPSQAGELSDKEQAALLRFNETCEDGEGYDVPSPMMVRLSQIGVTGRRYGSLYFITEYGQRVIAAINAKESGK